MRTFKPTPCLLCVLSLAVTGLARAITVQAEDDEAAIRQLTARFFAAFAAKNLEGALACWAVDSPEFAAVKDSLQETFRRSDDVRTRDVRFSRWTLWPDAATVRIQFVWEKGKRKGAPPELEEVTWDVRFVKKRGTWFWFGRWDPFSDLAVALARTPDREARARLLAQADADLRTPRLVGVLNRDALRAQDAEQGPLALNFNLAAIEVAQDLRDRKRLAESYELRSELMARQNRPAPARINGHRAATLFHELPDPRSEAVILRRVGRIAQASGNSAGALADFEASRKIWQTLRDLDQEAQTLILIAELHRTTGDPRTALPIYRQVREMARNPPNPVDEALALNNAGICETELGLANDAIRDLEASLSIKRGLVPRDERSIARTLNGLGGAQAARGEFETALKTFEDCRATASKAKYLEVEAGAVNNIGLVHSKQGHFELAIAAFTDSLKLATQAKDLTGIAHALGNLGDARRMQRRFAEAEKELKSAVGIYQGLGDAPGEAATTLSLALVDSQAGRSGAALREFRRVASLAQGLHDAELEWKASMGIAAIYQSTARYRDALDQSKSLLRGVRRVGKAPIELEVLTAIGDLSHHVGDDKQANESYEKALELARKLKDRGHEMECLVGLGVVAWRRGRFAEARARLAGGLKLATDLGARRAEAGILLNLGGIDLEVGRYADAMRQEDRALDIARAIKAQGTEAGVLYNKGLILKAQGDLDGAARWIGEGLKLSRENGDLGYESTGLTNLAQVALERGDFPDAMAKLTKALGMARRLEDRAGEGAVLNTIGIAQDSTGHYADALVNYQKSVAIFDEIGAEVRKSAALSNIALVLALSGRFTRAMDTYEQCLDVERKTGAEHQLTVTLINMGHLNKDLGRPGSAQDRLEEGLKRARDSGDRPSEALALGNLADLEESLNHLATALARYKEALAVYEAISDRVHAARTRTSLGDVERKLGHDAEAMRYYEQAEGASRAMGDTENVFRTEWGVGDLHRARGRLEPATEAYRVSIAALESIRAETRDPLLQVRFLAQYTVPYERLADCLLRRADPIGAFRISEQAKARALVEVLRGGGGSFGSTLTDDERATSRRLVAELTRLPGELLRLESISDADPASIEALRRRLEKARSDYEAFRVRTVENHPDLRARRAEFRSAEPADVHAYLKAHEPGLRVLSFLVGEDETLLFVMGLRDGPDRGLELTAYRIAVTRKWLEDAVLGLWKACAANDATYGTAAGTLYTKLLLRAGQSWKGGEPLALIPDGILHILPFQVLMAANGRHLVEGHPRSATPSR
jgi:tetratricopeptide (TPR) repeat protein